MKKGQPMVSSKRPIVKMTGGGWKSFGDAYLYGYKVVTFVCGKDMIVQYGMGGMELGREGEGPSHVFLMKPVGCGGL